LLFSYCPRSLHSTPRRKDAVLHKRQPPRPRPRLHLRNLRQRKDAAAAEDLAALDPRSEERSTRLQW